MTETSDPILAAIGRTRVLPVIALNDATRAPGLADALLAADLPLMEITLRTPAALDAIRAVADVPGITVGAGTVIDAEQVDLAAAAGARFVVSPGLSDEVVGRCAAHGLTCFPGVATPSEIMHALGLGLTTLKLFPAGTIGGPSAVKALSAPFPQVRFIPTGGIGVGDAPDYLALGSVLAVGGSWMVPTSAIDAGDFATVQRLAAEAVAMARDEEDAK